MTTAEPMTSLASTSREYKPGLACLVCNDQLVNDMNLKLFDNPQSFENTCDTTDEYDYCDPGQICYVSADQLDHC